MKPAAPVHHWAVGDRFRYNRWSLASDLTRLDGATFVITRLTPTTVFFRCPAFDAPTDKDRRSSREAFRRDVRRRLLVREP